MEPPTEGSELVLPTKSVLYVAVGCCKVAYWSIPVSSLLLPHYSPVQEDHEVSQEDEIPHSKALSARCPPLGFKHDEDDPRFCLGSPIRPKTLGGSEIMHLDLDGRSGMTAVLCNGNGILYLIGGSDAKGEISTHVMALKPQPPLLVKTSESIREFPRKMRHLIALERKGVIYIISQYEPPLLMPTLYAFYPDKQLWQELAIPRFLPDFWYPYDIGSSVTLSYILMEDNFLVSMSNGQAAYVYDFQSNRWEMSGLFGNIGSPRSALTEERCLSLFLKEGFLYEKDCLILLLEDSIVAYSINFYKVVKDVTLFKLPGIINEHSNVGPLVDLGNGYFCVSYTMFTKEGFIRFMIVTFKVSKSFEDDKFLECKILSSYALKVKERVHHPQSFETDDLATSFSFAV